MKVKVNIYKGTPDAKGKYVTYNMDVPDTDMVLDILEKIYHEYDPSLSYRYACGIARCGECAMVINDVPCLACEKQIEPEMTIRPLDLPLIKDTVINRRQVFDHIREILPKPGDVDDIYDSFEEMDEEVAHRKIENNIRLTTCFECMICQSMCPRYRSDDKGFPGPLGLLFLTQMNENPAQRPLAEKDLEMMAASCVACGKCARFCPAEKKPLHLALELLKHHPAKAVTAHMVDGKTTVQEVDESV
ncbi:MAG: 4Fe-4S dicluster domain-containing protein [Firmicutes bacterium]|nr:4Fe-4S dicluster domain-containing protein [Bacillota bacterium]